MNDRSRSGQASGGAGDADGSPGAVVLIPGWLDEAGLFSRMRRRLREEGLDVRTYALAPSSGRAPFQVLGSELAAFIHRELGPERPLSIVGFSMGGLVARWYAQRLGGLRRLEHLILMATPHGGSLLARFLPLPAMRQMRPGSAFLEGLQRDAHRLAAVAVSVWSPLDVMSFPPRTSVLGAGETWRIPALWHGWMPRSGRVIDAVARRLAGPPRREEDAGEAPDRASA